MQYLLIGWLVIFTAILDSHAEERQQLAQNLQDEKCSPYDLPRLNGMILNKIKT